MFNYYVITAFGCQIGVLCWIFCFSSFCVAAIPSQLFRVLSSVFYGGPQLVSRLLGWSSHLFLVAYFPSMRVLFAWSVGWNLNRSGKSIRCKHQKRYLSTVHQEEWSAILSASFRLFFWTQLNFKDVVWLPHSPPPHPYKTWHSSRIWLSAFCTDLSNPITLWYNFVFRENSAFKPKFEECLHP